MGRPSIVTVEAKKADVVPTAMVAIEPMAVSYPAHADHAALVTERLESAQVAALARLRLLRRHRLDHLLDLGLLGRRCQLGRIHRSYRVAGTRGGAAGSEQNTELQRAAHAYECAQPLESLIKRFVCQSGQVFMPPVLFGRTRC